MNWNLKSILFSLLLSSPLQAVDFDLVAQVGKRWAERNEQMLGTNQSYVLALHCKVPLRPIFKLLVGPSFVFDAYQAKDHCESKGCYSTSYKKIGVDLGGEFNFPLLTVFLYGRVLVYGRGEHKVSGRTKLRFPRSLSMFEAGSNEGGLKNQLLGFDLVSGMKWALIDKLSLMLSFELAFEKTRTDGGEIEVRNVHRDRLLLNSSLKSDWQTTNSSAIYLGLAYTM